MVSWDFDAATASARFSHAHVQHALTSLTVEVDDAEADRNGIFFVCLDIDTILVNTDKNTIKNMFSAK